MFASMSVFVGHGFCQSYMAEFYVLDLLPERDERDERDAATLASWLEQHGSAHVAVWSSDRGSIVADSARQTAQQATPEADQFPLRWHLGLSLDQLLPRKHSVLTRTADSRTRVAAILGVCDIDQTAHDARRKPLGRSQQGELFAVSRHNLSVYYGPLRRDLM